MESDRTLNTLDNGIFSRRKMTREPIQEMLCTDHTRQDTQPDTLCCPRTLAEVRGVQRLVNHPFAPHPESTAILTQKQPLLSAALSSVETWKHENSEKDRGGDEGAMQSWGTTVPKSLNCGLTEHRDTMKTHNNPFLLGHKVPPRSFSTGLPPEQPRWGQQPSSRDQRGCRIRQGEGRCLGSRAQPQRREKSQATCLHSFISSAALNYWIDEKKKWF